LGSGFSLTPQLLGRWYKPPMRYRQLGASDLVVSEIALGSWLTYGVGVDTASARACVDRAFEVGINFLDTANVYGRGAAERPSPSQA
jgi:aryl-alcohol dehydrogenase-like predicted oxidoreductase